MRYINGEKQLVDLLQHPLVNARIDRGIWAGISGGAQIDYGLSKVVEAIAEHPNAKDLIKDYDAFKQLNPIRYGPQIKMDYSLRKTPYYSARESMNS
jgi:hypothetical protein